MLCGFCYNPGPDGEVDPDAEFVELHNPGDQAVDLSGMSFTGFTLTFAQGTTLAPGEYAIVSPSISIAEAEWGITPLAEFESGGISGGGELIQLLAADGITVVDEVNYDDASPWPGAPDGNGPSLELINPAFDNTDPINWRPSDTAPTPGAINSTFTAEPTSEIDNITITPGTPLPGQAFTISATIDNATEATLTVKFDFGEDQFLAMTNVGGNTWQATVAAQEAGTLVRYRIDSDVAVAPFEGDTINYFGVVVSPTDIVGNELPVLQWYVDPAEFDELVTDLFLTNTKLSVVLAYGDQVIDNATVRVRGDSSRSFDKKSFKFELPDGYTIDFGDLAASPVDEFGLVADFVDWGMTSAPVSWDIFNAETDSFTSHFYTRVEQNGDFYGVYRFQELYDGTWRTRNGFDDGEFFKADSGAWNLDEGFERKEPDGDDLTSLFAARDVLRHPASAEKTAWLYDNINVPDAVNYMALTTLTRQYDQFWHNFYVDLDGVTERWELIEWDLDSTWRPGIGDLIEEGDPFTTPEAIGSIFLDSVWEVPEFRELYWQRVQTLVDRYLVDDSLIDLREQYIAQIGDTNSELEFNAWGRVDIFESDYFRDEWQIAIESRRDAFAGESRMPGRSNSAGQILINELHYNPSDDDAEFLELYNASSQAVDLSGWTIDGIDLTIGFGTVILPGDYVVFTDNDVQFRSQTTGNIYVGGQYDGGLSGGGETITLADTVGNVIDVVSYDDVAPWPTEPDGDGFTLALLDPSLDNGDSAAWTASTEINGTPGRDNGLSNGGPEEVVIFAAGTSTNEIVELHINGEVVASFTIAEAGGSLGDYDAGNFVGLRWTNVDAINISNVQVHFVNDFYAPEIGVDYNVRIDRIEIGSSVFETESPNVFSTGTYVTGVGFQPGFLQTEFLHGNGYFDFTELVV